MSVLILHGTWAPAGPDLDGRFFTWAERVPAGRRGRRPASRPREGAPHPFQARPEEVRDAMVTLSAPMARQAARSTWRLARQNIRLPSWGNYPLRSPEAARYPAVLGEDDAVDPPATDQAVIATWLVRGVALEPSRAVQLLASLPLDTRAGPTSALPGRDLKYWSLAAKLVLELLARERFVPLLDQVGPGLLAGWQPVLDDPRDAQRLEMLTRVQPPIARGLVTGPDGASSPRPPPTSQALLDDFVKTAIDALARNWLASESARRGTSAPAATASRAWLEALRRGERGVRAGSFDLERLRARLAEWRAPLVTAASNSPYRTCFRLEAPVAESSWTLRIFLQATDDAGLLLPAEDVWREQDGALIYQHRRFERPRERLLTDLARAARSFPPLERCLADAQPAVCLLTTEEAYEFLREAAWVLEESGFGALVPAWWDRRGPRGRLGLRLRLRPREQGRGALGEHSIVEYDWRLAMGLSSTGPPAQMQGGSEQAIELSEAEFRQLAALKVPLVNVRGQWIELRPDKIEQAITFWEKQTHRGKISAHEALQLALAANDVHNLPLLDVQSESWLAELLRPSNGVARFAPLSTPTGFVGMLRPYQERGIGWLAFLADLGLGACLADDMGLGKTIQYIAFLLHRRLRAVGCTPLPSSPSPSSPNPPTPLASQGRGATPPSLRGKRAGGLGKAEQPIAHCPSLVICPTSVVGNWRHELGRFSPDLRVLIHHGPRRSSGPEFAQLASRHDLVISSYALVHRDRDTLAQVAWDGIVLDEAQNVKNPATLLARAVRSLQAGYRFALTGTPIENRLSELWSIVDVLNPGYLGSQNRFRQRFVIPIERWEDQDRAEQLRRLVQPLILRRLKSDPTIIQDLPEKLEMKVYCTLTPEQATLYQAVVTDMLARIAASDGIERRGLVLATLTRLKQVCNHPAHFLADGSDLGGRSGKLERLQAMLEEALEEGDRALVFTQFAELGALLRGHLQNLFGREVLFLHGGVPAQQRDSMVARFQSADGPPIFVLSLRAGGTGLNLTAANHVFHFDRWWNPAVEDQATDRAFRIGQLRNVQVHKFVCAGTLEDKIDALIESKKALAEQVIGRGESWLTELSTAELREVVSLRAEAVVE